MTRSRTIVRLVPNVPASLAPPGEDVAAGQTAARLHTPETLSLQPRQARIIAT